MEKYKAVIQTSRRHYITFILVAAGRRAVLSSIPQVVFRFTQVRQTRHCCRSGSLRKSFILLLCKGNVQVSRFTLSRTGTSNISRADNRRSRPTTLQPCINDPATEKPRKSGYVTLATRVLCQFVIPNLLVL